MALSMNIEDLISGYGYMAVCAAIFLEDFGLPVPGETLLVTGSLLASQGKLHILPLLLFAWIAAVAGDNVGYGIGRFGGRRLVLRYGRHVFINSRRLDHAESFFRKHGGIVVVAARFFAVLRQLNGIVSGIARMGWWRFLTYNALGAALWVGFWGIVFYEAGARAMGILHFFKKSEYYLIGALVPALAALAVYLFRRK
jgi:membrane protein DedA with SNARE-associated domain